jgi:hypothetical protein
MSSSMSALLHEGRDDLAGDDVVVGEPTTIDEVVASGDAGVAVHVVLL